MKSDRNSMNQIGSTISLTETDRAILESYKGLCEGLSDYLGDGYEIVLHSLENFERSVIKIINGDYTGRKEGSPITNLALHMLEKMQETGNIRHISYFGKNKTGSPLHSCTIAITGEGERTIGLLCINFYMDTPMSQFVRNFFPGKELAEEKQASEIFVDSPRELIQQVTLQIRDDVLADGDISAQNRNKEIIARLSARGIFKLKDSVTQCAQLLGISRNTV